jgi:hypothetical protein
MKFDISVDGGHKAEIELQMDEKGGFIGTVSSPDYGAGAITNGVQTGSDLKGNVSLDGYDADFSATLSSSNATIAGKLSYGWFFSKNFTGISV